MEKLLKIFMYNIIIFLNIIEIKIEEIKYDIYENNVIGRIYVKNEYFVKYIYNINSIFKNIIKRSYINYKIKLLLKDFNESLSLKYMECIRC